MIVMGGAVAFYLPPDFAVRLCFAGSPQLPFVSYVSFVLLCSAVCGVGTAFASSLTVFLILRFFVGVGVGGSPAALSLYAEFLPQKNRGQQLIIFLFFFSVGSMLEALVAWATLPTTYGRDTYHKSVAGFCVGINKYDGYECEVLLWICVCI